MTGSLSVSHGKYFVIARMPDSLGKLKQKWINTNIPAAGNNKRKAVQKMHEILTQLEMQRGVLCDDFPLCELFERWMTEKKADVRENTLESYRYYLDKHIKPYFTNYTIKSVKAADIQTYYTKKLNEGQSGNTLLKHHIIIKGALDMAVRQNLLFKNPACDVKRPRKKKFVGKAYTAAQAKVLISSLDNEPIKAAVVLGLFYGLRRSEVCGLRWSDIDFDAGTMRICNTVVRSKTLIEHEQTKSDASNRTLVLIPATIPYLMGLQQEQALYPCNDPQQHVCRSRKTGKQYAPDYVSQRFKLILKQHGLPIIRFHELRHTAGSVLLEQGANMKQIQEFLGHEQISTTFDIYAHLSLDGKRQTADVMGAALGSC